MNRNLAVFTPYPFIIGEKIKITGGKRAGDWEVVGLTDSKVKLRCPVSGREFAWARFCYQLTNLTTGPDKRDGCLNNSS